MKRIGLLIATALGAISIGSAPLAVAGTPESRCIAGRMNPDGSCYYENCSEAEADGVCDIPEGDPKYCSTQDRDGDGVACEC